MSKLCASTLRCAFWICLRDHAGTRSPRLPSCPSCASRSSTQSAREDAHQVVFQRQVEARGTGVALAAGAAAQLVVDAARLVPLGADDVQAAERRALRRGASATPTCTARLVELAWRPRPAPAARLRAMPPSTMSVPRPAMLVAMVTAFGPAGLGDDLRLALVLLGVEHFVRDAGFDQLARTAARRSRSRWCRPAPAGRARSSP